MSSLRCGRLRTADLTVKCHSGRQPPRSPPTNLFGPESAVPQKQTQCTHPASLPNKKAQKKTDQISVFFVEVAGVEGSKAILTEEAPQSFETNGAGFRDRGNPCRRPSRKTGTVHTNRGGGGSRTRVQTGNPKAFYTFSRRFILLPEPGRRLPNPGPSSLNFAPRPEHSGALSPNQ